jgi:hypothetical protein
MPPIVNLLQKPRFSGKLESEVDRLARQTVGTEPLTGSARQLDENDPVIQAIEASK